MSKIESREQLNELVKQLPAEYATKLRNWWCRAQKPGKPYVIEYTDIEDLGAQVDKHYQHAADRAAKRHRRASKSSADNNDYAALLQTLADVRDIKLNELVNDIKSEIASKREQAAAAAKQKADEQREFIKLFESEHKQLLDEYAAMQSELTKLCERARTLKTKRARKQQTEQQSQQSTQIAEQQSLQSSELF